MRCYVHVTVRYRWVCPVLFARRDTHHTTSACAPATIVQIP